MKSFQEYITENKYSSGGNGPHFNQVGTEVIIHITHKDAGKKGVIKKIEELPAGRGKVYTVKLEDGTEDKYYREDIRRIK